MRLMSILMQLYQGASLFVQQEMDNIHIAVNFDTTYMSEMHYDATDKDLHSAIQR